MPFICKRRADIPNSTLQITDFWPNKSQANAVIDPHPQGPRYVNAPVTNSVILTTTGAPQLQFAAAYTGLAAYILANVQQDGAGGIAVTTTQADTVAAAIIAAMVAGSTMDLAAINAILAAACGAGTELTSAGGSLSTGAVTDVLRILAGATYTVPSASVIQIAGPIFNPQTGPAAWNAANFDFNTFTDVLAMDSSFYISLAQGQINGFTGASFTYRGTTGAALVVYSDTGAVL